MEDSNKQPGSNTKTVATEGLSKELYSHLLAHYVATSYHGFAPGTLSVWIDRHGEPYPAPSAATREAYLKDTFIRVTEIGVVRGWIGDSAEAVEKGKREIMKYMALEGKAKMIKELKQKLDAVEKAVDELREEEIKVNEIESMGKSKKSKGDIQVVMAELLEANKLAMKLRESEARFDG